MPNQHVNEPLDVRFWRKVQKTETCWVWTATCNQRGYGVIWDRRIGKSTRAHRASWELHHGAIPSGMSVLHHCDNPPCVNPEHLYLGTAKENMRDMGLRGRNPMQIYPERNPLRALNALRKIQCKRGHRLTEDNVTYVNKRDREKPVRCCLVCIRVASKKQDLWRRHGIRVTLDELHARTPAPQRGGDR